MHARDKREVFCFVEEKREREKKLCKMSMWMTLLVFLYSDNVILKVFMGRIKARAQMSVSIRILLTFVVLVRIYAH